MSVITVPSFDLKRSIRITVYTVDQSLANLAACDILVAVRRPGIVKFPKRIRSPLHLVVLRGTVLRHQVELRKALRRIADRIGPCDLRPYVLILPQFHPFGKTAEPFKYGAGNRHAGSLGQVDPHRRAEIVTDYPLLHNCLVRKNAFRAVYFETHAVQSAAGIHHLL